MFSVSPNSMKIVVLFKFIVILGAEIVDLLTQGYFGILLHPSNRCRLNIALEKLPY